MGPDFPEFHEFFSEIYEDIDGSIDPFAENIRKLGAVSPYRLFEFARMSNIEDTDVGYRELDLAKDILIYNAVMLNDLKKAFDIANQANEQGIANFIAERIDMHAKWDWQLKATTYQGM